jgi:death-on-curing protein
MMSSGAWARLIDEEKILSLHAESIERYGGGAATAAKDGCLERSIGAAVNAELYTSVEGAIPGLCFAGCLLFYLAKNHCFLDGNKRVSWLSAMHVLLGLNLTIDATEDEAEAYCLSILSGDVASATDVSRWMADKLKSIEEDEE